MTCRVGSPCIINCDGTTACSDSILNGDLATDVSVYCTVNGACRGNTVINCGTGDCYVECDAFLGCYETTIIAPNANSYQCSGICGVLGPAPAPFTASPTTTTKSPTQSPTDNLTKSPSKQPSKNPNYFPTATPSKFLTGQPTSNLPAPHPILSIEEKISSPTNAPITDMPVQEPSTSLVVVQEAEIPDSDSSGSPSLALIVVFVCVGIIFYIILCIIGVIFYQRRIRNKLEDETKVEGHDGNMNNVKSEDIEIDDDDIVGLIDLKRDQKEACITKPTPIDIDEEGNHNEGIILGEDKIASEPYLTTRKSRSEVSNNSDEMVDNYATTK